MLESFGMETKFVKDDGSSAGDNWLVLVSCHNPCFVAGRLKLTLSIGQHRP
jgi:hypothetical protein